MIQGNRNVLKMKNTTLINSTNFIAQIPTPEDFCEEHNKSNCNISKL